MTQSKQSSGFTLIEVLLAMAITALLFTGAFWSLHQVVLTRNAVSNRATPYIMGPAVLDVISADLANAAFYDLKDNNAFYATNAEISGREADALSLITCSKAFAPEEYDNKEDLRNSHVNEVAYVMRRGTQGTDFLELWRREDWNVDDKPHNEGDFAILYDKVHSLSMQFVPRTPSSGEGAEREDSNKDNSALVDGWNAVKEQGLPRAVQITLSIWARDDEQEVDDKDRAGDARIYTFKRFVALPQVHMSSDSEGQIATWDGKLAEPAAGRGGSSAAAAAAGAAGGRGATPLPGPTRGAGGAGGGSGRARGGNQQGGAGQFNPFMQALQGRGRPAGGGGGATNLGALFGGH